MEDKIIVLQFSKEMTHLEEMSKLKSEFNIQEEDEIEFFETSNRKLTPVSFGKEVEVNGYILSEVFTKDVIYLKVNPKFSAPTTFTANIGTLSRVPSSTAAFSAIAVSLSHGASSSN